MAYTASQEPQNADGPLKPDQEFCAGLLGGFRKNIFVMCTINSTEARKLKRKDTKADFIFKRVFNYLSVVDTKVCYGPARFSSFILPGFVCSAATLMLAMALVGLFSWA